MNKRYFFSCGCTVPAARVVRVRQAISCPDHKGKKLIKKIFDCERCGKTYENKPKGPNRRLCKKCLALIRNPSMVDPESVKQKFVNSGRYINHSDTIARETSRPNPWGRTKPGLVESYW